MIECSARLQLPELPSDLASYQVVGFSLCLFVLMLGPDLLFSPLGIPQVWCNVGRLLLGKLIRNVPRGVDGGGGGGTQLLIVPVLPLHSTPHSFENHTPQINTVYLAVCSALPVSPSSSSSSSSLSHSAPCLACTVVTENFCAFIHSSPQGRNKRLITGVFFFLFLLGFTAEVCVQVRPKVWSVEVYRCQDPKNTLYFTSVQRCI